MIIRSLLFFCLSITLLIFSACDGQQQPVNNQKMQDPSQLKEALINSNKQWMREEVERIDAYIERKEYSMKATPTGVRIMLISEGNGVKPKLLSDVNLKYNIELLDGSYLYSSDSSGVLTFTLGQSDEPSGLQEALLELKEGDKALVIVPSYLAYGLTGDGDKISGGQSLVYTLELLKVRNN
jgi:FKBP-type peptidyl-prolyl cis-trans isomerase